MYKITVVPFTKMLNFQSAFMPSSWPLKNKETNFPKIHDCLGDLRFRNYNARDLIVKHV